VAAGGRLLSRLLVSTARVVIGEETGGPLVNLSGQAIGINVAGAGSGLRHTGFRRSHERGPRRGQADPGRTFWLSRWKREEGVSAVAMPGASGARRLTRSSAECT
jgi:hypothetical protein